MTAPSPPEPNVRRFALGILATILAGVALPILFNQWAAKVDRNEFQMHVQQEEAHYQAILDILCADNPTHRRCR